MSWERELEELRQRQALAQQMGGEEKIARQRAAGRLTVRERIQALLDADSFHELGSITGVATHDETGALTGLTPTNFVFGRGRIDGRRVVVAGDDFTVRGGASDASIIEKQVAAEQMANELRMPIVRLIEGSGGGGSIKSLEALGYTYVPYLPAWEHMVRNLATVPVVSLGLGPIAGFGAAKVAQSHYSLLVRGTAQMFVAGPPVVAAVGQKVSKEELGSSRIHASNGAIDDEVASEQEAFARTRRYLSYLPSSVYELPPRAPNTDDPARREEFLLAAVPRDRREVYRMRPILEAVVDTGSFFEIGARHGRSIITGLARLDGWPVAIIASDPFVIGGLWTAASSAKLERFVSFAETFHLPVVHFVDNPGFMIGKQAEQEGTIRAGVRALTAVYQTRVPWCTIIIRKVFGVAGAGHQNHTRFHYRYAWPSADWGSLPIEGGIEAAYKAELEAAPDRDALLAEIFERLNRMRSPFRSAERFQIEEIIDPRDTRRLLCEFASIAAPLREPGPVAFAYRP
ncbi:MAG TPA: carboxyl transferase domain-containing protein [Steroidobacteraceae bacterium]|nr:carboxyl transferase domain-containing protein [Steroidobacteraceae bacterium]